LGLILRREVVREKYVRIDDGLSGSSEGEKSNGGGRGEHS
jgi:hypothetical protein